MARPDLHNTRAESLASIMDLALDDELWRPDELSAILRHQLAAPVAFDLSFLNAVPRQGRDALCWDCDPSVASFRDLFNHPRPPLELLVATKEFAKACRTRADAPLPDTIATILYLMSIVVARSKCERRISKLDDQALRQRMEWAMEQPWVDEQMRAVFRGGYRVLGDKEFDSNG